MAQIGNNGSDVYESTGDPRVDLSVQCVRKMDHMTLRSGVKKILDLDTQEALEDAYVLAFHVRNIRGGKGERDVFQTLFETLYKHDAELAESVMDLIPHYGCWDDLYRMAEDAPATFRKKVLDITEKQLRTDKASEGSLSLCAKWAPRETRHKYLATELAHRLFPDTVHHSSIMKNYRKYLSALNARLNTVETHMCGNRWADIKPETVPGRAGKIYNRAFLNLASTYKAPDARGMRKPDDADRMACRAHFEQHYARAAAGHAKVHGADTLFPHEVVKAARKSGTEEEKNHLRGVWRSMVDKVKAGGGLRRSIFMSDFSGSMQHSSAGDTPYWVSMALGLIGSEISTGEFKDRLMTFDSNPVWHTFAPGSDLFERIATIMHSNIGQGLSTNFQKAMDLVLQTLKQNRVRPGDEPENLIVLTDMNWNQACASDVPGYRHHVKTAPWQTHVEMIRESYKRAGEDMWGEGQGFVMPRIVIWNLAASPQTDYHATSDVPGVVMLSGWSATQFEILMKEGPRQITPYELLRIELDDKKYDIVRDQLRAHQEKEKRREA
jgi:hypothetical protein